MGDETKTNGWELTTVGEVATLVRGITYNKDQAKKELSKGYKPVLRANNINGILNFDDLVFVPKHLINSEQIIQAGDIIFAMSSGSKHLVGKSARARSDFDGSYGAFCGLLRTHKYVDKNFIYYIFQNSKFRRLISEVAKGSSINNLKREHILGFEIALPPQAEQHRIVAKIEELFSELDKGIESLKTARSQLKIYRQALLKNAFEGKLTADWRAKNQNKIESADALLKRIQTERAKHYAEQLAKWEASGKQGSKPKAPKSLPPLTADELAGLPELPAGWGWEKNQTYLFEVKDGTHDTPSYVLDGVPFVTQKNIRDGKLDLGDVSYISESDHHLFFKRSNVQRGDVIISMIGHGRGQCCVVDIDLVFSIKNVGLFKFFDQIQSNKFLCYYYQSKIGLDLVLAKSKGGAQPFIGLTELRNWPVPVCSFEEQLKITQELESKLSEADQLDQTITTALQQADALRQSILKKAFSGQLVAQDPSDEPAAALLARIKKEAK